MTRRKTAPHGNGAALQRSPGESDRPEPSTATDDDGKLARNHLDALAESGITPQYAAARGYETITDTARLAELNVARVGRNVPGLLVPQLRVDGSTWGYQYRPDSPRLKDGKPVEYETPVRQRNGIDIPPGVAAQLGNPAVPLWITEGVKKADCGALRGLCIVALPVCGRGAPATATAAKPSWATSTTLHSTTAG
jgi:hypothetical protein